ncbi:DUF1206 domain-containing protein [Streptomyces turgidiscabies]|uniref:Integral membrane family protein n=1 Tax=Streptomyces turgidiscabies (strain Car8) TaxID=698760 RepID=L7F6L1_STRT8|nr:DUF1206 domain-containing protein [Streptomyces turgidiscabies]ELP67208.1 integral membrane family protein [Streptomyces turgidiscabies Car8]MDX3496444.1 DUF1206 domain-containing protein [Streptomyces turgidiscabies]GAQ76759.1 hypothetical protein T45_08563 [Streptomyces turgidiscabies]
MTTSRLQGRLRAAGPDSRRSAEKQTLTAAGRAGFAARGVVYVLIGALAVRIAFGSGGESADRQGALSQIAAQPFGKVMLWALVVGFGCMALWRGAGAVFGRGAKRKAASRALDGGRALFYAAVCWATAVYAAGGGQGDSGNAQSQDWTASALKLPAGRFLVGAAGCVLIGVGVVLAVRAAMRRFLRQLDTGAMSQRTKQVVTALGVGGGVARGAVFAAAGIFVLVAAVRFDPHEAKGMDATLRSFTQTPAGPWLLVAVAIGLVLFGVFSFASARWRRL